MPVTAHYPSLPHGTVLGLGSTGHGMGKGVLFKMKGADGRGKLRHHSMETADSILQIVSGSPSAAAGGTGPWGRRVLAVKPNEGWPLLHQALEHQFWKGVRGVGQGHRSQLKRRDHSAPPVCSDRRVQRHAPDLPLPPHPNPHHVTMTQGAVRIPRAEGNPLYLG